MKLQEHIRKVLREETNIIRKILRRLPIEKMDYEFKSSLNYVSSIFLKNFKGNPRKLKPKKVVRDIKIKKMKNWE